MSGREPLPLRVAAAEVAARLAAAGFDALFAGGCVRDEILGLEPKDYDIATSATPAEIRAIFPRARDVGEAFGVMLVRHGGHQFEVATFRTDGPYDDRRRPSHIEFSTDREDAARRDFTINGIFMRPATGETVDYFGGKADIERRVVRAIRDPHERIAEDRLRMLRAIRFAARLDFTIEEATASAIRTHARELDGVSRERIGDELRRMLGHPARARAAALVESLGLDHAVFGACLIVPAHPRLAGLRAQAGVAEALAAWFLDRAALGASGYADLADPAEAVSLLRNQLLLSNIESDELSAILDARAAIVGRFDAEPMAGQVRMAARPGFDRALAILAIERPQDAARWRARADEVLPARMLPQPFLDGTALIRAGLRPGPDFKSLLDRTLDAQIEGRVRSAEEALAFALSFRGGRGG
ncbi:MAG: CCA tRNA nucleotidyltransferase [Planctomycetota bacterium]